MVEEDEDDSVRGGEPLEAISASVNEVNGSSQP